MEDGELSIVFTNFDLTDQFINNKNNNLLFVYSGTYPWNSGALNVPEGYGQMDQSSKFFTFCSEIILNPV